MQFQHNHRLADKYEGRDTGISREEALSICGNKDAKFFQIKSASKENVLISFDKSVWATSATNEAKFSKAFETASYVIFLFSINESRQFCGYSIMQSRPGDSVGPSGVFMLKNMIYRGRSFDVQWIRIVTLPYERCNELRNSLNLNKPVWVAKDGQEIEGSVGRQLCEAFERRWTEYIGISFEVPSIPGRKRPEANIERRNVSKLSEISVGDRSQHHRKNEQKGMVEMVNEILAIFPIDITNMTYEEYKQLYHKTKTA